MKDVRNCFTSLEIGNYLKNKGSETKGMQMVNKGTFNSRKYETVLGEKDVDA